MYIQKTHSYKTGDSPIQIENELRSQGESIWMCKDPICTERLIMHGDHLHVLVGSSRLGTNLGN
jgi:hypothetical protein